MAQNSLGLGNIKIKATMTVEDAPKVEVTPEMIAAGVNAYCSQRYDDPFSETVDVVYRAMEAARRK